MTEMTASVTAARPPSDITKRSLPASLVIHVLLIAASLLMLYPLLWMVSASVRPETEIFSSTSLIPSSIDFSSYARGWVGLDVSFGRFFWNSLVISLLVVTGNVIACSLTAFAFARLRFAGRNFWFAIMLGTLMIPYHVTLIPQYVLFLDLGWVNTILPLVVPKFLQAMPSSSSSWCNSSAASRANSTRRR